MPNHIMAIRTRRIFKDRLPDADKAAMKWLRRRRESARADRGDDLETYEDKLASRMRALPSAQFDNPEEVEARIRRMNYGAKQEHRPSWMDVEEWEARDTA